MGVILSKFRKEKTTFAILEKLEEDIKDIEQYSVSTQARQKRFVGNFLVISIGLYVIGFLVFYFVVFPPTWSERITYSVPMLIIPLLIFLIKRLVAWYFQRKLNKNSVTLTKLRGEKKKIIEKVMDTETYKVAIEILNRFGGGPKLEISTPGNQIAVRNTTPTKLSTQQQPQQSIAAYRAAGGLSTTPYRQQKSGTMTMNPALNTSQTPYRSGGILNNNNLNTSLSLAGNQSNTLAERNANMQMQTARRRTPYPMISQRNKGVLEKMVDYLIGDGPQHRFAMICKECYEHNGMALQEEYEYASFRCGFCRAMNPSRKSRPIAPKLPMPTTPAAAALSMLSSSPGGGDDLKRRRDDSSSSTSTSERNSGSDSSDDAEQIRKLDETQPENIESPTAVEDITSITETTEKLDEEKKND